jgi:DNA replication protein DnaC
MYIEGNTIHPAFGKAFHCICRYEELEGSRIRTSASESGMPERSLAYTFESFAEITSDPKKENAISFCRVLAEHNSVLVAGIERPGLFLWGAFGTGKTGLAMTVANARMQARQRVRITRWDRFVAEWQDTYSDKNTRTLSLLRRLTNADFILIDDVGNPDATRGDGIEPLTNDAKRIFNLVIEEIKAKSVPFIITSNFSPQTFGEIVGLRNANRVFEFAHPVQVAGESLRK